MNSKSGYLLRAAIVWLCLGLLASLALSTGACKQGRQNQDDEEPVRSPEQIGAPAVGEGTRTKDGGVILDAAGIAQKTYYARCATCHGLAGRGDGGALKAFKLKHKPKDWTDPAALRGISDEELTKTILYGGSAVGKSPDMPAFGDMVGKFDEVNALRAYVRSFARP